MVKVLLVDNHPVVRTGLKALLETTEHVEVVGEASSGEEAVDKAETLEPDVVIMDLAVPGIDGVQAMRRITGLGLGAKILVFTVHDEDEYLVPALNAGAAGFLNKSAADTDLIGAIEAISHGYSYLPRHAAAQLARRKARGRSRRETGPEVLSARERAAVELYSSGFSAAETGKEMGLSPKSVEGYLARAKAKLGLHTRREVVRFAVEAGLLRTENER
ncbi:MAG: response regulator transcription factor [Gemmatimonadetes bacterium]|nr:response regulator transcription factor [Gemmatimonadota bacterium]